MREEQVLARGKHLALVQSGRWEFARRVSASGVVMIAARTVDNEMLLVEQYRVPIGARVVELPAGLAGDEPGQADESLRTAAHRELLEETGYEAAALEQLHTFTTSAGMTDERVTLFRGRDCVRKEAGGGEGNEDIEVHCIPLTEVESFLEQRIAENCEVDGRVLLGLYYLTKPE